MLVPLAMCIDPSNQPPSKAPDISIRVSKEIRPRGRSLQPRHHSIALRIPPFPSTISPYSDTRESFPLLFYREAKQGRPQSAAYVCTGCLLPVSGVNDNPRPLDPCSCSLQRRQQPCQRDRDVLCVWSLLHRYLALDNAAISLSANDRARALSNNFPSVELNKHCSVSLEILDGNGESEVVQKQKLKL